MGMKNIDRAVALYAETLRKKPAAMLVLMYMARYSVDGDIYPWCATGHHKIAQVMGRPKGTPADLRAVGRVMTDLRAVGAITTERTASPSRTTGPRTARYGLHLDRPASMKDRTPDVRSSSAMTGRRVDVASDAGRPTAPDAGRPTEEDFGLRREKGVDLRATATATGVRGKRILNHHPSGYSEKDTPADGVAALKAAGLRSRRFQSLPGGRTDDDVGDGQLALPMVAAVPDLPDTPEPVAEHHIQEAL